MAAGRIILSEQKLNLVLDRLAHQLIELHGDFGDTCLIGIQPRGIALSDRLVKRLHAFGKIKYLQYGMLDITFHRDDFRTRHEPLKANITKIDFLVDNKKVVLIDDVLYTGRTIQAAISALQHFGRPEKIELLVLIHGRSKVIVSSTSFINGVIKLPIAEVNSVSLHPNVSFNARNAGVDIITSPILSARMHKIFLHAFQFILQNYFCSLPKVINLVFRYSTLFQYPFGFIAVVDKYCFTSGRIARLNII